MEVSYGLGRHRDSLSKQSYKNFLKYNFLDSCQFFWALAMLKISVCLFLLRLSQFDRLKRVLWTLVGFLLASTLVLSLLIILQCQPVYKWDLGAPGRCFSADTIMKITITQGGRMLETLPPFRTSSTNPYASHLLPNRLPLRLLPRPPPPQPQHPPPLQIRPLLPHRPRHHHRPHRHRPHRYDPARSYKLRHHLDRCPECLLPHVRSQRRQYSRLRADFETIR